MSTFTKDTGRVTEVNGSRLALLKRHDSGAYTASPVGLTNPDGVSLKVEDGSGNDAALYCATPSGPLAPGNQTQVPTREYVDGDITTVVLEFDFNAVNALAGGTPWAGAPWADTFTSTYVVPQDSYVTETFVWTRDVWNGAPAAPGPTPPTTAGVYVSVGSAPSGPTAPFAADFNRFGQYLKMNSTTPRFSEVFRYWDRLTSPTPIYFNVYIPTGTAGGLALTNGSGAVVLKIVKAPRL
jgi:hypothetical protein